MTAGKRRSVCFDLKQSPRVVWAKLFQEIPGETCEAEFFTSESVDIQCVRLLQKGLNHSCISEKFAKFFGLFIHQ